MKISKNKKYTKNFNMYIYPNIAWSKVSIDDSDKNIIIYVSMLPIKNDKTRWFVSIHHNFNNDNSLQKSIMKISTELILNQDYKQFNKMYPSNKIKDECTFHFMLKNDLSIEYIKELLKSYTYPNIEYCSKFIKMTYNHKI